MSGSRKSIGPGSRVTLRYRMLLEDGTVADETGDGESLTFTLGDGTLIAGLESLLNGLVAGESANLLVMAGEAFGLRDPGNVHPMPRDQFPDDLSLEPGTVIGFTSPSGEEIPGTVLSADPQSVQVDFNHPLAGHNLNFQVAILSVD